MFQFFARNSSYSFPHRIPYNIRSVIFNLKQAMRPIKEFYFTKLPLGTTVSLKLKNSLFSPALVFTLQPVLFPAAAWCYHQRCGADFLTGYTTFSKWHPCTLLNGQYFILLRFINGFRFSPKINIKILSSKASGFLLKTKELNSVLL